MAIGDALGASTEFRPYSYMQSNPITDMIGGGTWGLAAGQWTDDTSMALCLAISLIVKQGYNAYDQLVRYMSSTGRCFDIGNATSESLGAFIKKQKDFSQEHKIPFEQMDAIDDKNQMIFDVEQKLQCSREGVCGNGALMRLTPVPLFFFRDPPCAVRYAGESGFITHGDPKVKDACRYYSALITGALLGYSKEKLLDKQFYLDCCSNGWFGKDDEARLHSEVQEIADGSFRDKKRGYEDGIRGKGYIVSALEAALWAFCYDGGSFETGVLNAVNLGDDTDTTAAIYGQLAGAYYGVKGLPKNWLKLVYAKDFIKCLSKWLEFEGDEWYKKNNP
ncbi:unnamed protein product [Didymodactylos carnosus]|uniref:ADP-ribosylglycohydrolase n=1 Tax=Didymodactylos carnosus TaxID=1234261 RepID=A0A815EWT9_9BILA|nr:unnamed protein product [Didymodactylos carnosus]CAF1320419.1 unnamed protein product [Didymodactylos carnosus]CAF3770851.1 unnamed protein product [Didymodactylos carnosus]CAF4165608.1 unnamed protein product [Didymodactylos carnosus]